MRVIKVDTLLRVVYTLAISLILARGASAQTVLTFAKATVNDRLNAGFTVTNPTSNYADVQFTLYGVDGNPVSSGLVNPVRYRVVPKGQISMLASELFAASKIDGWIQVTSPTSGLAGYYFSGDFVTKLEGAESSLPLTTQVVPFIRDDATNKTELVIVNPGTTTSTVTVTLFNARGEQAGTISQTVTAHASLRLPASAFGANPTGGTFSARISASLPVAATAIINRSESLLFAPGQPMDQPSTLRVAPHFTTPGFDPVLVLTNPNASPITVTVTLFGDKGAAVASPRSFTIPANGSISADAISIVQQPITPTVNGWLRVESPNVALDGLLILDGGPTMTAIPLESAALDRMIYSQMSETTNLSTGLVFVNPWAIPARLDISLVRNDGTTFAQSSFDLPANSKYSSLLRDMIPDGTGTNGYIVVHSSVPVYSAGLLGANNRAYLATIAPARPPDAFTPNRIVSMPRIYIIDPGTDVQAGTTLRVSVVNVGEDGTFLLGDQIVTGRQAGPFPVFSIDIPAIEPGSVKLHVRSRGVDSDPVTLHIVAPGNSSTQNISGKAMYQKTEVTDAGLDLNHPVMVPVRNARVEVLSRSTQSIVAVSETDQLGRFNVPVPLEASLTVRVVSGMRFSNLRVADNTNLNALYAISSDIDGRQANASVLVADTSRVSGAFNILEMVQRANETIRMADPTIDPPPVTIFWSTKNTRRTGNVAQGFIGTSFFNVANNTAYILGDRNADSDEFDDSVIVHEYGHMLAARFSRDDSPGGVTHIGDILDPRLAWSEGWANFFSSVVRNDPVWRDDSGPNGINVYRFDLSDKTTAGDTQGYWSETSVGTLLWELYQGSDLTGNTQYPFSLVWSSFTDLRNDHFVYLPYFLEHLVARNPAAADAVQAVAQFRSVDFRANVRPSVTMPFPRPMSGNTTTGYVDSFSPRRTNLMQSSHYWSFTTNGGAASIRMDITGLGPAGNPATNDLDIFLMDSNGRLLDRSDRGLNGQSELISLRVPAGTYVVEVRSFYLKAETGNFVFNSGDYRLSVAVQ
ncbi:MAG TPA: DUF5719 family protein [Terriglobia bacterium]|nr:DUF5719 family protein [Terriglobia bacterium]